MRDSSPAEALTDEALMLDYLGGSDKAFEIVYRRRRAGLRRFFERQCGSAALGQELAQDVWFKLVRACQKGQYTAEAKFTTFLYRIARNTLIDWYRSSGAAKTVEVYDSAQGDDDDAVVEYEDTAARDPEQLVGEAQSIEAIRAAIEALPAVQKTTLLMYLEGEMNYDEIAEAMNTKRETVKTRLRYARQALKMRGLASA